MSGGGWILPEEAASLRAAASDFHRLDRLCGWNVDYYLGRTEAARILAGRVEELLERLRQRRNALPTPAEQGGR